MVSLGPLVCMRHWPLSIRVWPVKEQVQIRLERASGPGGGLSSASAPLTLSPPPPLSKCGSYPPESCLFSLIGNLGAFMVALICLLRYGQLLEQSRHSWVNTTTLITGCTNAAGLVVVGNFQVHPPAGLSASSRGIAMGAGDEEVEGRG